MRKSIIQLSLALFTFLFISENTYAQKKDPSLFLGGNLILGFPSGDFSDGYSYASGLEGSLGFGITEKVYLVGTLGYLSYKNKDSNPYGKIRNIPMKAGIRLYPYKAFFIAGNAGLGFIKDEAMTSKESRFVYDIGLGVHYTPIQAGFYYDGWKKKNTSGSSNTFQIKVGFAIK